MTFPLESYGGIQRQISAHFTLHFGNLAAASQVSRRKQTCSKSLAWSKSFHSLSQHFLALFPARPEHCAHTTNMSKSSGLKSSICYKKNEVSKQGLFVVGRCQMGWGLPGRLYHVEIIPRTRKCAPSNIPELIQNTPCLGLLPQTPAIRTTNSLQGCGFLTMDWHVVTQCKYRGILGIAPVCSLGMT